MKKKEKKIKVKVRYSKNPVDLGEIAEQLLNLLAKARAEKQKRAAEEKPEGKPKKGRKKP